MHNPIQQVIITKTILGRYLDQYVFITLTSELKLTRFLPSLKTQPFCRYRLLTDPNLFLLLVY